LLCAALNPRPVGARGKGWSAAGRPCRSSRRSSAMRARWASGSRPSRPRPRQRSRRSRRERRQCSTRSWQLARYVCSMARSAQLPWMIDKRKRIRQIKCKITLLLLLLLLLISPSVTRGASSLLPPTSWTVRTNQSSDKYCGRACAGCWFPAICSRPCHAHRFFWSTGSPVLDVSLALN
jgi:hypothetical protein